MREGMYLERLFAKNKQIDPWPSFREDVRAFVRSMTVSHKPKRHKQGQLHNDTTYGITKESLKSGPDSNGCYTLVVRKPLDKFKQEKDLEAIRDARLRKEFLKAFREKGAEGIQELAQQKNIRQLRRTETLKSIPIKDKQRKSVQSLSRR